MGIQSEPVRLTWRRLAVVVLAVAALVAAVVAPTAGGAATPPTQDSFYSYSGSTPLAQIKPGTVLKTRALTYHVAGIPVPLAVTQLLFRSTNEIGQPDVAVTSVVHAPGHTSVTKAISYQSFYDSLNPADEPSYSIAGGVTLGGSIPDVELTIFGTYLLAGYSVIVPDTEGETADFAAGPEYGMVTLDSIRASENSPATGLSTATKVGLIGYSGGAIATGWAAALQPTYAPELASRIVGAAEGGVLVDPDHNLHYIEGSAVWAGVLVMAIIGIARANHIDLSPYMSAYGQQLYSKLQNSSIATVLGAYPGLTWAKIAKPAYPEPEDIPIFVQVANKLDLGSVGAPTIPMFIGQGANGILEGTPGNKPGIGPGDGVMVAGDVRSLARQYCAAGSTIDYQQYNLTSHVTSVPLWLPEAVSWLGARFGSQKAPNNCSSIAAGNSLAPIPTP